MFLNQKSDYLLLPPTHLHTLLAIKTQTTNKSPYLNFHVSWYILIYFIIEHQSYKVDFFPYHRLHFRNDKRIENVGIRRFGNYLWRSANIEK